MRILHVITMLDIGGAERLMVGLLPLLRDAGNEVELLLFNGVDTPFRDTLEQKGIKIHELSHGNDVKDYYKEVYDPRHIIRLRKFMHGYDIIHTHNFVCQFYVALSHFLCNSSTPIVTTEHSTNNRRRSKKWFKIIDQWMYSRYSAVICIADETRTSLESYIGARNNIYIVNNGIDVNRFLRPVKDISKQNTFNVTMVAALRTEKDHETLIKAMEYLPDNYHLRIVGDGVRVDELKAFTERMSMTSKVEFTGARLDIPEIWEQADVAVLSSHWESFGLAAVEAMAAGRPMIASDVGGLHDVVGGAGILFPHGDSKTLAEKIQYLCEHPEEYRQVAQRCQEKAKQYDISIMAEKYSKLYNNINKL